MSAVADNNANEKCKLLFLNDEQGRLKSCLELRDSRAFHISNFEIDSHLNGDNQSK